jgi:hypothetical protein
MNLFWDTVLRLEMFFRHRDGGLFQKLMVMG